MRPSKSLCQLPDCTGVSKCPACKKLYQQQWRESHLVSPTPVTDPNLSHVESPTPPVGETAESPTPAQSLTDDPVTETPTYTPSTFGQPNHVPFWTPLPNAIPTRAKCSACSPPGQDLVLLCLLCVDNRFRCQQCLSRTAKFYPLGSEHVDMAPPRMLAG